MEWLSSERPWRSNEPFCTAEDLWKFDMEKRKDGMRMKNLLDTIQMMGSKDFKERFKAEYWQLNIRCKKLGNMCRKYSEYELDFTPKCSLELLQAQLGYMRNYLSCLEQRAEIEGIDLNDYVETCPGPGPFGAVGEPGPKFEPDEAGTCCEEAHVEAEDAVMEVFAEKARDLEAEYAEQVEQEKACEECTGCIDECSDAEEGDTADGVSIHVYDREESVWASVVIDEKDCHIRGNCEYLTSVIFDALTKEMESEEEFQCSGNCHKE